MTSSTLLQQPTFCVLPDTGAWFSVAADQFVELARSSILARGRFTVALAGGNAPRGLSERLAAPPLQDRIDWRRVEVFWGDERGVRPDHPDANYRMAASRGTPLGSQLRIAKASLAAHHPHGVHPQSCARDPRARRGRGQGSRAPCGSGGTS
jgi:6-phosphogluconolactonase/glucosamine-6-phosphate isomerase/deaminase